MKCIQRYVRSYAKRRRLWIGQSALVLGLSCALPLPGTWARSSTDLLPSLAAAEPSSSASRISADDLWADVNAPAKADISLASNEPQADGEAKPLEPEASPSDLAEAPLPTDLADEKDAQDRAHDAIRRRMVETIGLQMLPGFVPPAAPASDAFVAVDAPAAKNDKAAEAQEPKPSVTRLLGARELKLPDGVARSFRNAPRAIPVATNTQTEPKAEQPEERPAASIDLKMLVESTPAADSREAAAATETKPPSKRVWSLSDSSAEAPRESGKLARRPKVISIDGERAGGPAPIVSKYDKPIGRALLPVQQDRRSLAQEPAAAPRGFRRAEAPALEDAESQTPQYADIHEAAPNAASAVQNAIPHADEPHDESAPDMQLYTGQPAEPSMQDAPQASRIDTSVARTETRPAVDRHGRKRPMIVQVNQTTKRDPLEELVARREAAEAEAEAAALRSQPQPEATLVPQQPERVAIRESDRVETALVPSGASKVAEIVMPQAEVAATPKLEDTAAVAAPSQPKLMFAPSATPAATPTTNTLVEAQPEAAAAPAAEVPSSNEPDLIVEATAAPAPVAEPTPAAAPIPLSTPEPDLVVEAKPAERPVVQSVQPSPPATAIPPSASEEPRAIALVTHRKVDVDLRQSSVVRTTNEIARAEVIDSSICDVIQFSPGEVSIIGKREGQTHVRLWFKGQADQQSTNYLVAVGTPRELKVNVDEEYVKLRTTVADLYPTAKIEFIEKGDKLYVRGTVASREDAVGILSLVRRVRLIPVVDQLVVKK